MSPDTIIVLLTCAVQVGALVKFLLKWESKMASMDTVLQILAAKNGIPYAGNGAK